jgi:hypothetical protein
LIFETVRWRPNQVPRAVGGAAVNLRLPRLTADQIRGDRGVAVVLPGRLGELLAGDDPGFRARHHVNAVAIPAGLG